MKYFDAVVIGGGILGCFTARNLRRWKLSVALVEKEKDVCTGITRANSAIVYAGYDNKPGSLKAELTVRGNANMAALCEELDVPFVRCGSLLVTYDPSSVSKLERKMDNGHRNGVPGMKLLSGAEAEAMEPMLAPGVVAALYAPSTGTVNPWQLGIAAFENALHNGVHPMLGCEVVEIEALDEGYRVQTSGSEICCKMVLNCAGLSADRVQELIAPPSVRLELDGAEYLVFDPRAKKPDRIIFHQADSCGKGITAIPCVEGNLLISGVRKPLDIPFATTYEGVVELKSCTNALLQDVDMTQVIRSFGAVRPNPRNENGESIADFCIENPIPGFYSLIGIKTPGLTASNELGLHLAKMAASWSGVEENPDFDGCRTAIPTDDREIICQCGSITKGQVLEAISRGAATVDGVKRRVGTGMGPCQGGRCEWRIAQILKQTGANPDPLFER